MLSGMPVDEQRVNALLAAREAHRERLDFDAADDLKEELLKMGVCTSQPSRMIAHPCAYVSEP